MRLTRAAEYAVRCMVYLGNAGQGVLVRRNEMAEDCEIPPHFLAKVARDLARAKMIVIRQGARGGFLLARDPEDITLLEIVETMVGEIYLNDCVANPASCTASCTCAVNRVWQRARDQLRATLEGVTLARLISEGACEVHPGLNNVAMNKEVADESGNVRVN